MKAYVSLLITAVAVIAATSSYENLKITGGKNATFAQFPFIASLQARGCDSDNNQSFLHICAGTIISPSYILTAAHCVNRQDGRYKILKVSAGLTDLEGGDETYRQDVGIEKIIIHSEYNTTYETYGMMSANDLAIVKLSSSLKYNEGIQPISLPKEGEELEDNVDMEFIGWGDQVCFKASNPKLQTIDYFILNYEICYNATLTLLYDLEWLMTINKTLSLCTGPLNNGTYVSVKGDSGGPLIKDGIAYGLYSWVFIYWSEMVAHGPQGPSGIFVKLSRYISWITENVDDL